MQGTNKVQITKIQIRRRYNAQRRYKAHKEVGLPLVIDRKNVLNRAGYSIRLEYAGVIHGTHGVVVWVCGHTTPTFNPNPNLARKNQPELPKAVSLNESAPTPKKMFSCAVGQSGVRIQV